jgi:two-component system, NarL family, response regulator NreC
MRSLLEQQPDWKVCGEAENGREGIRLAEELKPDIILIDLTMPVMNGLEAARELKRMMPKVPLVMWTLAPTAMIEQEAFAAGISFVCTKLEAGAPLIEGMTELLKAS